MDKDLKAKKTLTKADILAAIKASKTASFAIDEESSGEIDTWYDTGCYGLNLIMSGSIFKGCPPRVVGIAGEEATGKTYIVQGMMKEFLQIDPEAMVDVWDTESTMNRLGLESRGIDASRVILHEEQTVEEFSSACYNRLLMQKKLSAKEKFPLMIALDSLGGLSTIKALTDMENEEFKKDMTKAGLLKSGMIALNKQAALADVPVLVTNHVYEKVGSYTGGKEMGGGSGLKYMASIIIFLSKSQDYNEKTKQHDGIYITATAQKSRFIKPKQKVKLHLSFEKGLDRYYGLLEPAVTYGLVTKPVQGKYLFPNHTDAVKEDEIFDHPEKFFTVDFLQRFDAEVSPHYCFGSSTDEPPVEDEEDAV